MATRTLYSPASLAPMLTLDRPSVVWLRCGERVGQRLHALRERVSDIITDYVRPWPQPMQIWPASTHMSDSTIENTMTYSTSYFRLLNERASADAGDVLDFSRPERKAAMQFVAMLASIGEQFKVAGLIDGYHFGQAR